jgi:hypothetical protein
MRTPLHLLLALTAMSILPRAQAGLTFSNSNIEAHAAADADKVVALFPFENDGSEPVTIDRHDSGCTCLGVEVSGGKMKYAPGEKGELRATFDIGNFRGVVDKPIQVWLKGDPEARPSIELNVRVFVPVLVEIEPKTLRWLVGASPETQTFHLKVANNEPIKVLSATGGNGRFDVKLITIKDGESYDVQVTPHDLTKPGIGMFQIETDSKTPRHKTIQGFASVMEPPAVPKP